MHFWYEGSLGLFLLLVGRPLRCVFQKAHHRKTAGAFSIIHSMERAFPAWKRDVVISTISRW